jgi:hypothetical protein
MQSMKSPNEMPNATAAHNELYGAKLSSPMASVGPTPGHGANQAGDKEGDHIMQDLGAPKPATDTIGLQITEDVGGIGHGQRTMMFPSGSGMRVNKG